MRKFYCAAVLVLLLTVSLFLAYNVRPVRAVKTWIVDDDGPADFHTIGEAVTASGTGDTIQVRNGIYNEHVAITSKTNLTICGEDRNNTIIDGTWWGPIVTITYGSGVVFANFTVRNAGWTDWYRDTGIRLVNTKKDAVSDCLILGCAVGINLVVGWSVDPTGIVINGNTVSDCTMIAIGSSDSQTRGVIVTNNTVTNCTGPGGIYFNIPINVQFLGNHVFGTESQYNDYGIHLQVGGYNNTIVGNRVEYAGNAIRLDYADGNIVEENSVENCTFGVFTGYESSDNVIVDNNASGCDIGFMLWDNSNNNLVTNNRAVDNDCGIALSSSNSNKIYHNNFINNIQQVSVDGQPNGWDDGYPSGGNYWSDYTGSDSNADGIGDTPYYIDGSNEDRYPLMDQYSPVHDIAALNVTFSKTIVGEGYTMTVSGDIDNRGDCIEYFDLMLYANSTLVGTYPSCQYAKARSEIPLVWNTAGIAKGYYELCIVVPPVEGDINGDDNNFTAGWVFVTFAGDVTSGSGVPEGKVDMRDIALLCTHFARIPQHPLWDANMDINDDLVVNMRDIAIACSNFMKT